MTQADANVIVLSALLSRTEPPQYAARTALGMRLGWRILVFLLCITSLSAPLVAAAEPEVKTASKTISLKGYDLSTPEGSRQAQEYIAIKIRRLCRSLGDTRKVDDREAQAACFTEAQAHAMQDLSGQAPDLTKPAALAAD